MRKIILTTMILFAILATLIGSASAQGEELIVNGSFETPVVNTAVAIWDIYPSGSPGLGWLAEWYGGATEYQGYTRPEVANFEFHQPSAWPVFDGIQYAELDTDWVGPTIRLIAEPASIRMYQDVPTCRGGIYELKYAWSPRPNNPDNQMEVWWGDTLVAFHSGAGTSRTVWTVETWSVTASGSQTRLSFVEIGNPDGLGMFLDGVSLIQTNSCQKDVDIDIKPGKYPNVVYLSKARSIPVSILGSANFDVLQVDRTSLNFAGLQVWVKNGMLKCWVSDVSGDFSEPKGAPDGYLDLTCVFVFDKKDFRPNPDGTATLTGTLLDGTPFYGTDDLIVRP